MNNQIEVEQTKVWAILWLYSLGSTQDSDARNNLHTLKYLSPQHTHQKENKETTNKPNKPKPTTKQKTNKEKQTNKPARLHMFSHKARPTAIRKDYINY